MDERQKDLSNYRITQADDSLKVADYCLKETNESIYITQNDEGDMVIKSIDTYEMVLCQDLVQVKIRNFSLF